MAQSIFDDMRAEQEPSFQGTTPLLHMFPRENITPGLAVQLSPATVKVPVVKSSPPDYSHSYMSPEALRKLAGIMEKFRHRTVTGQGIVYTTPEVTSGTYISDETLATLAVCRERWRKETQRPPGDMSDGEMAQDVHAHRG